MTVNEEAVEAAHFVTVTPGNYPDGATIKFECRGDQDSLCHYYPSCECEAWSREDHEHPFVVQDTCWMQDWFDVGGVTYEGEDADIARDNYLPDSMDRSGEIAADFCGEWIEWSFKP